jgi:NAD(P)-dependent dehydrogenase (short-subunit alcohol dehydrogenase family)
MSDRPLTGVVAVVTGASRGIGRGIAVELGAAGATVYVTGRTLEEGSARHRLPGTIGATAEQVTAAGGRGIPVRCDHHVDAEVEAVFAQVSKEQGRLDVLVNNVFSAPDFAQWMGTKFWELPVAAWDETIDIGLRSHYVASVYAARMMVPIKRGLIVNISSAGSVAYSHNVPYGVGKAGVDKLTADTAHELADVGVAVVSLWPGLVKTELVLSAGDLIDVSKAETPEFTGRAVVALATDERVMARSGQAFYVADLAKEYGFTELDGSQPERPEIRPLIERPSR